MELRVLLFQEENTWVAQCLEYDIAAQGRNLDDALYEVNRLYYGQVAIRRQLKLPPLQDEIQPAPQIYWQQYEQAAKLEKNSPSIDAQDSFLNPVDVSKIEYRLVA